VSESADFQKGLTAYDNGDYATALREWKPLAEQGYYNAQNNLGVMYDSGRGVPQDYKTAVKWYRLAAEQGVCRCPVQSGIDVRIWRGCSTRLHPCPYVVKYCRIIWEK